jgi:isopropylmalate/homocitrate/citramalate synthase
MEPLIVEPIEYTHHLSFPSAEQLRIYDSTLRDGEQMPGVALSPKQKLLIAQELSDIGCHILDIGFPIVSETERRAVELILRARRDKRLREDIEIVLMCRCVEDDIVRTVKCVQDAGCDAADVTLLLFTSASSLHCKYKLGPMLLKYAGVSPQEFADVPLEFFHETNRRLVAASVRLARACGVRSIEFGAEDASRTPVQLLAELARIAVDAGATRFTFADTTGCLTPEATRLYCTTLADALPGIQLASHFHNDFGLAVINVITALQHGFTVLSTTANGIGERAGNAALHSVVVALRVLYGVEIPGFRYERLNHLRRVVEELSGVPVQCHEPVVGHNAFAHESGIHVHGVSVDRRLYEAVPIEMVGGSARRVYGKHSGVTGVLELLRQHEDRILVPVTRELAERVLGDIKRVREERATTALARDGVREYYARMNRLGVTEQEVIDCAVQLACMSDAARAV